MLKLEQPEVPDACLSAEAISDIQVVDKNTTILRKAIDTVFSRRVLWLTENEKIALYKDFLLSKLGVVQFTDNVSAGTKNIRNVISEVQQAFEELMELEK
ncbi:hypothetical protein K2X92_00825 [Candidatus Gracilibacteria bacterium]|nr:hypothetical protein [Candidatus Gracilibacteria bacterium]